MELSTLLPMPMLWVFHLGCRLKFDHRLDADLLRRAVRLALDAEPVLGCVLHTGAFGGYWQRLDDLDERVPFSVQTTDDPDRDSVAFHAEPIGDAGPRIAARLLRSPDSDDLCLKIDHLVADGQSAKELAYLIASTYSLLATDPAAVAQPMLEPRPSPGGIWKRLTPEQQHTAMAMPRPVLGTWHARLTGGQGRGLHVRELRLGPERLAAVREYGRERGGSVNDMLLAAYFRAIAACTRPSDGTLVSFSFTVDHRRFLDPAHRRRIVPVSSVLRVGLHTVADETFHETLLRVVKITERHRASLWGVKQTRPGLPHAGMIYTPRLWAAKATYGLMARLAYRPPVLMNIGVLEEERLGFGGSVPVDARILGTVPRIPGLAQTISTYRDTLTVWMGLKQELVDPVLVDEMLRVMDRELTPGPPLA